MHPNTIEIKPVIGISCGDVNGIGPELIIKTLSDIRILDVCTPVVFANNKVINFYKKALPDYPLNFVSLKDLNKITNRQINVLNCWEDEFAITPGELNETGGKYAVKSLIAACTALAEGKIEGLITAPIHKNNVQSEEFSHTGNTPFLKEFFNAKDVLMLMTAENIRVGLLTEHVPVKDIVPHITREAIISKLQMLNASLKKDFGIAKPKIAVLGLNPHSGDEGLIGKEEIEIIKPAIKDAKQQNMLVSGPFSADAFFARAMYDQFDAVLAMYHDQGLIPFKSLAIGEGVNFTAGLNVIRTSPDHGTAFDIAGKNKANEDSFRQAIYTCLDIIHNRNEFDDMRKNPMKKMGENLVRNAVDEKITEEL